MDMNNSFKKFVELTKSNNSALIGSVLKISDLPNFAQDAISQASHIEKTKSENLKYLTQQNGEFTHFSKNRQEVDLNKNTNTFDIDEH